jgi:hypothetical protein
MSKVGSKEWQPLSFHFRHKYEQGYRYLDTCGEFMVRAEMELGFVANDAQPTGAKMDHPDHGTHLELDVNGLTIRQESPPDDGSAFLESTLGISKLASELVRPNQIYYSGFAAKHIMLFSTEAEVFAASLRFGMPYYNELADSLGMTPHMQELTYDFTSGSYAFQVSLKSVAFNSVKRDIRRTYPFRSTANQRRNVDRWNALEDSRNPPHGYALMLEADLREQHPPEDALPQQFAALQKYIELLKSHFMLTP